MLVGARPCTTGCTAKHGPIGPAYAQLPNEAGAGAAGRSQHARRHHAGGYTLTIYLSDGYSACQRDHALTPGPFLNHRERYPKTFGIDRIC